MIWLLLAPLVLWAVPLWCYVGYPLLCRGWSRRQPLWLALPADDLPPAVVVCVYHNEQTQLPAKLANCRALDYPAEKLSMLFVSDASDDGSDASVRADGRAELLCLAQRGGKSAGLNAALAHLQKTMPPETVVVFTDANTALQPDAVRRLAEALAAPAVTSACGELTVSGDNGEAWYWRGEQVLKRGEGAEGCLIGANGALHALRLRDWTPLPDGLLMEDLLIPLRLLPRGRAVYVPAARAREESSGSDAEFRRKVRIAAANFAMLPLLLHLPLPPRARFCLWSHKILRWLCAPLLLPLLLLTLGILFRLAAPYGSWLLLWLALPAALLLDLQNRFYGWTYTTVRAAAAALVHGLLTHVAFTVGLLHALAGSTAPHWEHDRQ